MDTTDQQSDSEAFRGTQSSGQAPSQHLSKVVIQKIPSRLYYSNGDAWTPDIEKATMFDTGWEALEETTHLNLQNFQLVPNRKPTG